MDSFSNAPLPREIVVVCTGDQQTQLQRSSAPKLKQNCNCLELLRCNKYLDTKEVTHVDPVSFAGLSSFFELQIYSKPGLELEPRIAAMIH